jgi:hypothetical protein
MLTGKGSFEGSSDVESQDASSWDEVSVLVEASRSTRADPDPSLSR